MSITLAPTEIIPDHIAAVVARLRRFTNVMDLCPDEVIGERTIKRVSANLAAITAQRLWTGHAVVVVPAGGDGDDPSVPLARVRFDAICYGTTGYEAARLARIVSSALTPLSRRGSAFTQAECRLSDVLRLTEPLDLGQDRENQAHRRAVSFEATKKLTPVGV